MTTTKKHLVFPAIAASILLVVGVVGAVTVSDHSAAIAAQETTLDGIAAELEEAQASARDIRETASLESKGARAERVTADTRVIEAIAERTLTWNSHESYEEARAATMRAYELGEDDPFMQAFLPPAPVNKDAEGNEYPYIDAAGLNSRVSSTSVELLAVDGVDYSYLALVDVESASSDGLGAASNIATILVTIDGDGEVTALTGYASTTPPVTSG